MEEGSGESCGRSCGGSGRKCEQGVGTECCEVRLLSYLRFSGLKDRTHGDLCYLLE